MRVRRDWRKPVIVSRNNFWFYWSRSGKSIDLILRDHETGQVVSKRIAVKTLKRHIA